MTNIYVKDANGYTPLNEKFVFDVDTSNEIIFSFGYKIETYGDYYYDIDTEIIVVNLEYKNLFNYVFPCNLIDNQFFSLDLTLLDKTNIINQDFISLSIYNANYQNKISFDKDPTSYQFTSNSIPHNNTYNFELFYSDDSIPFYSSSFHLTNFDRSRVTYNIAETPFIIDFTAITCDLSLCSSLLFLSHALTLQPFFHALYQILLISHLSLSSHTISITLLIIFIKFL